MRRSALLALSALLLGLLASGEAGAGGDGYRPAGKPSPAARASDGYRAGAIRGGKRVTKAGVKRVRAARSNWRPTAVGPLGVVAYYDIGLTNDYGYGECALVRHLRVWDGYQYRPTWAYPCSYY